MPRAGALDQFYTDPPVARMCHSLLLEALATEGLEVGELAWLEPAVGEGAFFHNMPMRRLGLDVDPRIVGPGIRQLDFFQFDPRQHWEASHGRLIVCAGNPPFGRAGALAAGFFNHAARFAHVIAFIVPCSFRKPSVQQRLERSFHPVLDYSLPEKSFVHEGRPYDVPCCFQVWIKRSGIERRRIDAALSHPDFDFVPRDQASVAVRRVGRLAGKYFLQFSQYADESHYFIRPTIDMPRFLSTLDKIDWRSLTAAQGIIPSIGKRALVRAYSDVRQRAGEG